VRVESVDSLVMSVVCTLIRSASADNE